MSLWKIQMQNNKVVSPMTHVNDINKTNHKTQRASFCTCHRGSLTVEAAVVVPLVTGFLVCILFMFQLMEIQLEIEEAVLFAGRKVAVESSVTKSEELLLLSAKGFLCLALEDSEIVKTFVKNGILGVSLSGSKFDGKKICLLANYEVALPISFFGNNTFKLYSRNTFQKWVGDYSLDEDGKWVYITPNGIAYHKDKACRVLDLSVKGVAFKEIETIRGSNGQKYYKCSRCVKEQVGLVKVYCTNYGSLYHKDVNCSSLKRTVERVEISEVGERVSCSFCYE